MMRSSCSRTSLGTWKWASRAWRRQLMARRPTTLVFSVIILVATAWLFMIAPKGLFPTDDTGQLLATTEAAEGVSFDALVRDQQLIAATISKDPDVRSVTSSVGTTAAANQGQLTIDLKPIDERKRSADDIARDLTKAVLSVPDISVFIQNPPAISIGGLASKSLYQYTLQSGDINTLDAAARELETRLRQEPALTDVTSDLLIENPQVTVAIDRETAGQLGVSAMEIENTLYDAFGQRQVSTIYTSTNEYWVVMELLPQYQSFIHPVTILSGLPFAAFGALVTLLLFRLDLDIYGFVGIIMLIGIVEKNAIMMIDFAIEAQRAGDRSPAEAILEAASVRFRPIMMTTMAALMGAIPIAIGWGAGASTRRPLGVAVVGGLAFSQLVTLYVTPVFYTYLDELQQRFSHRPRVRDVVPAGAPESAPGGHRPEPAAT